MDPNFKELTTTEANCHLKLINRTNHNHTVACIACC